MFTKGQLVRRKVEMRDNEWWRRITTKNKIPADAVLKVSYVEGTTSVHFEGIHGGHTMSSFELVVVKKLEDWM